MAEFLLRLKGYEEGYAFAFFKTPEELKMKLVQAIHDQIGHPGVSTLDAAGAKAHLARHLWGSRKSQQFGTWLGRRALPSQTGGRLRQRSRPRTTELPRPHTSTSNVRCRRDLSPRSGCDRKKTMRNTSSSSSKRVRGSLQSRSTPMEPWSMGDTLGQRSRDTISSSLFGQFIVDEDEVQTAGGLRSVRTSVLRRP